MRKRLSSFGIIAACLAASTALVRADDKPIIPLKVQIVVARYQGDKKVGSLPYTLVVHTGAARASLKIGSAIPIVSANLTTNATSWQYRDVGINIDCSASVVDEGRFRLDIALDDSSVYADDQPAGSAVTKPAPSAPAFRHFTVVDSIVLRDGQTTQYTVATDKVNGEVTKVDVTMTVLK